MNSRDVVGLYEAYSQIYEGKSDDNLTPLQKIRKRNQDPSLVSSAGGQTSERRSYHKAARGEKKAKGEKSAFGTMRHVGGPYNEEVDVYDLVLDYLLDEGYCDDVESAEVIMANMSEEWLDEILDEAVEIMSVTSPTGERRKGSRVYSGRASLNRQNARKLGELQKRQALNPRAQGSRSARRQSEAEFESNAKKSVTRLNAKPNTGDPSSDHQYHLGPEDKTSYYPEVPTDYRARKRRASGR